ncbi:MAG: HupE/UreJ family protein [Acidobacteriia bacterium]|nr:HupE/UreJ family protein [Terriglobia bacterium]
MRSALFAPLLLLGGVLALPAIAHDIPNDVTVQMFLHPSGNKLDLLVRVPLKSMRDIDFPKLGPGYLDLSRADQFLQDGATVWLVRAIEVDENDTRLPAPRLLAVRPSLESDKSFASYETAMAHITGPKLPESTQVPWDQVMLDAWLQYPITSERSQFSIRPNVDTLGVRVITVLRFLPPGGTLRAFEFEGDEGLIQLDPSWYQASLRFVRAGFLHILDGTDHLLFLLCLVIPFRQFRQLLLIVTSFTVAHSFTLIASAYGLGPDALWFPPLIETLIAMSILYMALENIVGASSVGRRWMVTFVFGLVHGFGFSFALRQTLQFAGSHLLTSLVSFNLGVELGQLLVLAISIPLLDLLFRYVVAERMGTIILSALVAHTAWHWVVDRWGVLRQFPITMPVLNAEFWVSAMRWTMVLVALAALVWLVSLFLKKGASKKDRTSPLRPT